MFTFWSFFLKKTQFSVLLTIALALFGLTSLVQMPKESTPPIEMPLAIIVTALPGANATDVEKLVTNELEDPIKNNLENIKSLTSKSSNGVSSITVEFNTDADIKESITDLKDEIDTAKGDLPTDATEPQVIKIDFAKEPVLTFAIAADVPRGILLDLSKKLTYDLEQIPGVSSVSINGVQEREVHVLVKKEALTNYGLSLNDVARSISAQNIALPTGSIAVEGTEYPVRFSGDIKNTSDIALLPIAAPGGTPVTVGDIATVIDGFNEASALSRLSINGNPSRNSFTVDVFKKPAAQLTEVGDLIKERLTALEQDGGFLNGTAVSITFDRAELLATDLTTLSKSGMTTVLLVMIVLFFAIGGREALVAGLAIPLSFLTAFIGLKATGNSLNFVSLFALILSTGIIVDSSIVVVEGINAHMRNDDSEQSKVRAALKALKEYYTPLTAGTLTTVAVFAPLFTISGVTGEFIATIPYTIIFVLLASLFVALALIPVFSSLVLKRSPTETNISLKRDAAIAKMTNYYKSFLRDFLGDKRNSNMMFTVIITFFILSLSLPILGAVRTIFFPSENSEYVFIETELNSGAVLADTDLELRKIEEAVYSIPNILSFSVTAGRSSPYSNVFEGVRNDTKLGNILMTIDTGAGATSQGMAQALEERLSEITSSDILVGQMEEGPPTGAPITITFSGTDLDALDTVANDAKDLLKQIPGTSGVSATTKDNAVEFVLDLDRYKSISNGVTPLSVAQSINTALAGTEATTIKLFGDDIPVTVRMDLSGKETAAQSNDATIDALRYIPITNDSLLGSFINTNVTQSRTTIRHEDGQRITVVTSNLTDGANAQIVTNEFKQLAEDNLKIPEGITMSLGGENEEVDQSFADMFTALIMGMVAMFAILVIQFNSARQTVYILLTVPLSLIGVFAGLLIMDKPLSFPSIMGFIALAGIVVNNGIILIDVINRERREAEGRDLREVIIAASASRLRPVLLTAITTVVGILPLVFAAELWAPLAYSIIFGLTFATVLTLVLLPAIYYRWPGSIR
jgi:HAE1 family hydrophobic/amphiphilic exporter-1